MDRIFDVRVKSWKMRMQQDWERSSSEYGLGGGSIWGRAQKELVGGCQNFSGFLKIGYRYFAHRSASSMQPQCRGAVSWLDGE